MDARHTGHAYHFLDRSISFAKQQPRKYLWERNAYFYTPGAHGTWENFTNLVDESLSAADQTDSTIWGPILGTGIRPLGPDPPVDHPANDNYTWGVGEDADLITYLPIFNPKDTQWTFPDKIWNFRYGLDTPRRTAVITMGRYSRRLLDLIHNAQATRGLGLASEMTGPSWALYHGLKAVHVPHPIYADGQWTPHELARIYNRGSPGNINGGPDSIWTWDHLHDHIMYRLSYMFTTHTAEDLYRRWLGYRTMENEGGKKVSGLPLYVFLCLGHDRSLCAVHGASLWSALLPVDVSAYDQEHGSAIWAGSGGSLKVEYRYESSLYGLFSLGLGLSILAGAWGA